MRHALLALALSACVTALHVARPATLDDAVGQAAPPFALVAQDGSTKVALADTVQRGPVVLVFYRGHW